VSSRRNKRRSSCRRTISFPVAATIVGVLASLPPAIQAVQQLGWWTAIRDLDATWIVVILLAAALVVSIRFRLRFRSVYRHFIHLLAQVCVFCLSPRIWLCGWAHTNQDRARDLAPKYQTSMTLHPSLLKISSWELAKRSHLPWGVAFYFLHRPDVLIREDCWPKIASGLFMSCRYFEHGIGSYGRENNRDRLLRYHSQGVRVSTYARFDQAALDKLETPKLDQLVRQVEEQLLRENQEVLP
jgi:hypothetical protein